MEGCEGGGVRGWRGVRVEGCEGGGVRGWRGVRVEGCEGGGVRGWRDTYMKVEGCEGKVGHFVILQKSGVSQVAHQQSLCGLIRPPLDFTSTAHTVTQTDPS